MLTIFFAPKKDRSYTVIVWSTTVILLLSMTFSFSSGSSTIFEVLISLLVFGLLMWIWFGTNYRIKEETIKIKNGPFKWTVKIQDIEKISKRRSLLATPALSVDRLVLHYGKYGEMSISPKAESEFIELLLTKNPLIKISEKK